MDLFLRFWAVVLFLSGVPFFLGLAVAFGTMAFTAGPNDSGLAVPKFLMMYCMFALAGLLTAAGCIVGALAKMAYPRKGKPDESLGKAASMNSNDKAVTHA